MTRRGLLAGALAAVTGLSASPYAPGLVYPEGEAPLALTGEVCELSLHDDCLMVTREPADHVVTMSLDELSQWPLSLTVNGRDAMSRGDLIRELRRLLAILEGAAPIIDATEREYVSTTLDLVPGTAQVTGYMHSR